MSMTKTFYHEAICEMTSNFDEGFYFSQTIDETEINWFSGYRISFDGYQEFECHLCGQMNDVDELHAECEDREKAWTALADEDFPF